VVLATSRPTRPIAAPAAVAVDFDRSVVTLAAMGPAGDEGHDGHDDDHDDDPLGADDAPFGAPPDRMDRLWVHPAELSAVAPQLRRRSRSSVLLAPLAAGALGAIAAVVVLGVVGAFDRQSPNDRQSAQRAEQRVAEGDAALSELARAVAPGIVLVTVNDAFGARQSSGVCVRHSGDVLTSAAVVGDAKTAQVTTTTGETMTAAVLGRDDATGLVLLHSERPLRAVPVSEETSHAGDSVWIFGAQSPKEGSPWISSGIVSSADAVVANAPGPMTAGLLETDALGTAAAAGGALVDRTGAVNGIVLWPQGEHRGAYAVPIARAVKIADELRENGYVAHGAMPVEAKDSPMGPMITEVPATGPAARAGLQANDVIVAIDGSDVLTVANLVATMHSYRPGSIVELDVVRNGQPMNVDVTLDSTPAPAGATP
jgi:S1-C subfamily serine protease